MKWYTAISEWLKYIGQTLADWLKFFTDWNTAREVLEGIAFAPVIFVMENLGDFNLSAITPFVELANIFVPISDALDSLVLFVEVVMFITAGRTAMKIIPGIG